MNFKTITTMLVAVIVVVLIAAAAIVPIVQEAQNSYVVASNNDGAGYTSVVDDSVTLSQSKINDVGLSTLFPDLTDNYKVYVITDTAIFTSTYRINNQTWTQWVVQFVDPDSNTVIVGLASAVLTEGTATITVSGNEYSVPYEKLLIPSTTGNYGAYNINDLPKYVDSSSTIYVASNKDTEAFIASGTLANLSIDLDIYGGSVVSEDSVKADFEPRYQNVTNGLFGFTVSAEHSGYVEGSAVVFIPLEYHMITSGNDVIYALLGVISLLIFVVPIMLIVRSFYNGRD